MTASTARNRLESMKKNAAAVALGKRVHKGKSKKQLRAEMTRLSRLAAAKRTEEAICRKREDEVFRKLMALEETP